MVNQETPPAGHSRFGASKAERWLNCTASVLDEAQFPNQSSEYAREGTALHAVSAHCLTEKQDAAEWIDRAFKYDDHGENETIEIDEEQAEAVQVYLDAVRADQTKHNGKLLVEARFHLAWLHPEFFGTSDAPLLGDDHVLRVYDAKFGRGKVVEVHNNPQLAYYGLGAVEKFKKQYPDARIDKIELVIVQPRAPHKDGPVRRSKLLDHTDLLELADRLVVAAGEALGPAPKYVVGDHCTFCTAAGACKALRRFAVDTAQMDFDDETGITKTYGDVTVNPLNMTPEQVRNALEAAGIIKAWLGAVEFYAYKLLEGGQAEIPGWKLVERRATRKWLDEEKAASELSLVFGLDAGSIFKQKILSPAQIEKKLKKEDRPNLAPLYDKKSSGTWIARDSDTRDGQRPSSQSDFDDGATAEW